MKDDQTTPKGNEPYCPFCGEEVAECDVAPDCPIVCKEGENWKACKTCAAEDSRQPW
jgi:hypothetical protein